MQWLASFTMNPCATLPLCRVNSPPAPPPIYSLQSQKPLIATVAYAPNFTFYFFNVINVISCNTVLVRPCLGGPPPEGLGKCLISSHPCCRLTIRLVTSHPLNLSAVISTAPIRHSYQPEVGDGGTHMWGSSCVSCVVFEELF